MKNAVVTGANRGIGLELVKQLKQHYTVYAICRTPSHDLTKLNVHVISDIDVTKEDSIKKLQDALKAVKIDLLINNAGIAIWDELPDLKLNTLKQIEVNAIAPLMVTKALERNLREGSKVIMISSRMGSIEDNTSGKFYGYRASKTALNSLTKTLTFDLAPRKVLVGFFHPGSVDTEMNPGGEVSSHDCVKKLLYLDAS